MLRTERPSPDSQSTMRVWKERFELLDSTIAPTQTPIELVDQYHDTPRLRESRSFDADELVSFVPLAVLKLQVELVRPRLFSTVVTAEAAGATEPGVRVGSSLGSFRAVPFQALPGTNSGMPKLSSSLVLVLVGFSPELGQPASLP